MVISHVPHAQRLGKLGTPESPRMAGEVTGNGDLSQSSVSEGRNEPAERPKKSLWPNQAGEQDENIRNLYTLKSCVILWRGVC